MYREAGTYPQPAPIDRADQSAARLSVPADAQGTEIHIILEATDDGQPPLIAYRRVIVEVGEEP